jgi:hypothetical protein
MKFGLLANSFKQLTDAIRFRTGRWVTNYEASPEPDGLFQKCIDANS